MCIRDRSTFVLLLLFYQGFEWIASRRASKVVLGLALVVFLVLWPQLAGRCTLLFPQTATVFGVLGYAVLPMMNFTGDLSLPVILVGLALYFAKRSRIAQVIALNVVSFGWHFVPVSYTHLPGKRAAAGQRWTAWSFPGKSRPAG